MPDKQSKALERDGLTEGGQSPSGVQPVRPSCTVKGVDKCGNKDSSRGSGEGSGKGAGRGGNKGGGLAGFVRQGRRYLIVGFASAAIDFCLFTLLYNLLGITAVVNALGFGLLVSNVAAIAAATVFNFLLSRSWTFGSVSSLPRSVALYLVLFILNQLFASAAILWLSGLGLASPLAKLLSMACIVCWNFFLYRKVVFR